MNKKSQVKLVPIFIVLLVLIGITTFCFVMAESPTTYDFTVYNGNKAYGQSWDGVTVTTTYSGQNSIPPAFSSVFGANSYNFTTAGYTALQAIDASYANIISNANNEEPVAYFNFTISEAKADISWINVTMVQKQIGTPDSNCFYYIANYTSGLFVEFGASMTGTSDVRRSYNYSGYDINNIVDGTNTLALSSISTADDTEGCAVNYVGIVVGYESAEAPDSSPIVTLNSPVNNSNETGTIEFNCTASDDLKVENVSLYGNWTGWHLNETNSSPINNTPTIFTKTISDGIYIWNCQACDNKTIPQCSFANANRTFTIDNTKPTYSNNQTNTTTIGASINFSILYEDNIALHPNGQYVFSTNNTGIWVNESLINWTSTPQWANVTKTLNSTSGLAIGYRWYANDSVGNWNNTGIYVLTTSGGAESYTRNITENFTTTIITDRTSSLRKDIPQSLTISILVSRIGSFLRDIPQSLNINNLVDNIKNFFRDLTDSFNMNILVERIRSLLRTATQSINISSLVERIIGFLRNIVQKITITIKMVTKAVQEYIKTITQSLNLSNIVNRITDLSREVIQSFNINSLSSRIGNFFRNFSQTLNINSLVDRVNDFFRNISQILNINILVDRITNLFKTIIQSFNINELVKRLRSVSRTITQSFTENTLVNKLFSGIRGITQNIVFNFSLVIETIGKNIVNIIQSFDINLVLERLSNFFRDTNDSFSINSLVERIRNVIRDTTQSIGINELVDRISEFIRTIPQTLSINVLIDKIGSFGRIIVQAITLSIRTIIESTILGVDEHIRTIAQSFTINNIVERIGSFGRIIIQMITTTIKIVTESLQEYTQIITQILNLNNVVGRMTDLGRDIIQSFNINTLVERIRSVIRTIPQTLNMNLLIERIGSFFRRIIQLFSIGLGISSTYSSNVSIGYDCNIRAKGMLIHNNQVLFVIDTMDVDGSPISNDSANLTANCYDMDGNPISSPNFIYTGIGEWQGTLITNVGGTCYFTSTYLGNICASDNAVWSMLTGDINITVTDINTTVYKIYDLLLNDINLTLTNILNLTNLTYEKVLELDLEIGVISDNVDSLDSYLRDKWGNENANKIIDKLKDIRSDVKYLRSRYYYVTEEEKQSILLSIREDSREILDLIYGDIKLTENVWIWIVPIVSFILLIIFIVWLVRRKPKKQIEDFEGNLNK